MRKIYQVPVGTTYKFTIWDSMHKPDIYLAAVTELSDLSPLTSSPFILYLPVSQHTLASSTSPSIPFSLSSFSILSFSFLLLMSSIAKIYTKMSPNQLSVCTNISKWTIYSNIIYNLALYHKKLLTFNTFLDFPSFVVNPSFSFFSFCFNTSSAPKSSE